MVFQDFLANDCVPFSLLSGEIGVGKTYFAKYRKEFTPQTKKFKRFIVMTISTTREFLENVMSSKSRKKVAIKKFLERLNSENKTDLNVKEEENIAEVVTQTPLFERTQYGIKLFHYDIVSNIVRKDGKFREKGLYGIPENEKIDLNKLFELDNNIEKFDVSMKTENGICYYPNRIFLNLNLSSKGREYISPIYDYVENYRLGCKNRYYVECEIESSDKENFEKFKMEKPEKYEHLSEMYKKLILDENSGMEIVKGVNFVELNNKLEAVFQYLKENKDERLISEEDRSYLNQLFTSETIYSEYNFYTDFEGSTVKLRRYYITASDEKTRDKILALYNGVINQLVLFNYLHFDIEIFHQRMIGTALLISGTENYSYIEEAFAYYKKYEGKKFILGDYNEVPEAVQIYIKKGKYYEISFKRKPKRNTAKQQKLHHEENRYLCQN